MGHSVDPEAEAAKFLERDFTECFSQMRHYDGQIIDICKFMFTAYTALAGVAVAFYQFSIANAVNLVPAACLALAIGLIVGLLLFCLAVRNRVYFVFVTRYINEHRKLFLRGKPLGFQNVTGMYTDPSQPPFFNWRSSQSWLTYIIAGLNATLLAVLLFVLFHDDRYRWWILVVGSAAFFAAQLIIAICYLRSREAKPAEQAVFGR